MLVKECRKKLEEDGWYIVRTKKHRIYEHATKKPLNGRPLALSKHDNDELAVGTANGILKNAGLK
jgi:predicted RNA binding protein YcfA (HicA-like mRNA interferase family)